MKAIGFNDFGPHDILHLTEVPAPEIRPNDLLVRNHAAGVNRADILQRNGAYGRSYFGDSDVMGLEIAGEVIGMGREVQGFRIGDRVMGIVGGGAYAELARIDYRMAMPVPKGFGYAEAAAIPEVFVTAHEALFHLAALQAGDRVLIHAAASGVGTAAVQLAAAAGAEVFVTASGSKLPRLRELGANVLIDYKAQDFASAVADATGGAGVNVVVDFVGAPYFERNIHVLANGGRLIQVGTLGGSSDAKVPLERILYGHLKVIGTVMKSRTADEKRAMVRRFSDRWLVRFDEGTIRPVVDSVFPLANAGDAHRQMESNQSVGKIILEICHAAQ
ncbi:NAD(P)H-quinone oxidoreductase [Cupriavidus taiwanensis]|uniref:Zinc-containing alcohol dehydrogenase superfamily n=1 Tax=Cupriavidus taiwanensis TaxID=164546 RepID=A0A375GZ15_9BURK|nr:NAD(P)H-quinone oxidoreductase [Cupriavidus taiwanensis]SOY48236.1 Zinc-containing alcohol dehydrogenase superfamily [Cupriavidus taiwanensis]SOY48244.1 Zinc-containing alcohol dehydrogenase superfamily [Cupriavidus taiwanensis]SOY82759.1 Zinc-containing alcohol dehydrogenase superfamily [Cupriavidus taiwanensis]SOZ23051.1 Zinc-containing alcohol dehydrogenase superfamily [Cupriavidus taiwanensis]SOZ55381.1 Zinc-containing alcohol dehydrogenase superfamily [Cupriavidus taiwanensis]